MPAYQEKHCPRCGFELHAGATYCWLCGADARVLAGTGPAAGTRAAPPRRPPIESAGGYSLASLMMFVTLAAVVLGLSTFAPGVGIPLGLVALVAWLRTAAVVRHRRARRKLVVRAEQIQLFLTSVGVGVALIALTCLAGGVALVAALLMVCTYGTPTGSGTFVWLIAGGMLVATLITVIVLWAWIIRRRWRSDVGPD